jgi:hypothetical protein
MLRLLWILCALCVATAGVGAWNYRRNAAMEQEVVEHRPYRQLSEKDLGLLEEAYQQELAVYTRKVEQYARAAAASGNLPGPTDLQGNVDSFQRVQASAERMRQVQGALREREAEIANIKRERELRAKPSEGRWDRILRRTLTF